MLLKAQNSIIADNQPATILTADVAAGAASITVKNNSGFAQNDYVLIGNIRDERAEIKRITAAVSIGASLTVAPTFAHDTDTPVIKVDYDQVQFFRGTTTSSGDLGSALTTKDLDPSAEYTYYEDTANTTGYGFIRFKDSNASTYSVYSIAIPYTGYTPKMLRSIRKKVRRLLNEPDESIVSDDEIDDEINLTQKEIAHLRLWSWYENTKSFSSVANQYEYDLASDCFVPYEAKYDSQPMTVVDLHRWNLLRWDSDTTGDPTHICLWRKKARVYPYPSASADTTTLTGTHNATITTITVASTSSFREQGRIIIESEVISYTGKTSTTFTGCTRGEEGTTAATHTVVTTITVTERDFIYHFQEDPDDLTEETDETSIPDPSVLAYKSAAELALQIDNPTLHDRLLIKYDRGYSQLIKTDESKYKSAFGRVKSSDEMQISIDQNKYPLA